MIKVVYSNATEVREIIAGVESTKFENSAEVYYNTGDVLPTDIPMGSVAVNTDTWAVSIFNGTKWVLKG